MINKYTTGRNTPTDSQLVYQFLCRTAHEKHTSPTTARSFQMLSLIVQRLPGFDQVVAPLLPSGLRALNNSAFHTSHTTSSLYSHSASLQSRPIRSVINGTTTAYGRQLPVALVLRRRPVLLVRHLPRTQRKLRAAKPPLPEGYISLRATLSGKSASCLFTPIASPD